MTVSMLRYVYSVQRLLLHPTSQHNTGGFSRETGSKKEACSRTLSRLHNTVADTTALEQNP